MPWNAAQSRLFHAIAAGARPHKGNLSPGKAKELLDEAKSRQDGQKRAIKRSLKG